MASSLSANMAEVPRSAVNTAEGQSADTDLRMVRIKVSRSQEDQSSTSTEQETHVQDKTSEEEFLFPAAWLCQASPVLRAMLTGMMQSIKTDTTCILILFWPRRSNDSMLNLLEVQKSNRNIATMTSAHP
jgi:hypothetical protein